jgi:hypothetical protein
MNLVAAPAFRLIHREIGVVHDLCGVPGVTVHNQRDSNAGAHTQGDRPELNSITRRVQYPAGNIVNVSGCGWAHH